MKKLTHVQSALLVLVLGIGLAIPLYKGRYSLIGDPVSALGQLQTESGGNLLAFTVFGVSCIASSYLLFPFARRFYMPWMLIADLGLLFLPIPCDKYPNLHSFAAALLVGGLFFWEMEWFVRNQSRSRPRHRRPALLLAILICGSVLFYAFAHVSQCALKEEIQTFAVVLLVYGMIWVDLRLHFRSMSLFSPSKNSLPGRSLENR